MLRSSSGDPRCGGKRMDSRTVLDINGQNLELDLIWGNEGVGRVRLASRPMSKPVFMTLPNPIT